MPSDFHLFPKMKEFLGSKWMATDGEANETDTGWLNGPSADCYDEGIARFSHRPDKCLNWNGDYIEK
jgi:hypothetical protein